MSLFRIDMLPGREGDCLWIEYGDPKRPHRMLIDGGRQLAWATLKRRFSDLPQDQRKFELLMLSHVDADHVEGLLKLVDEPELPVDFNDVWFNGRLHLERKVAVEDLGSVQGERFSKGILAKGWDWNAAFDGKSVVIPDSGKLPVKKLAGGMTLTLLSPNFDKLTALAPKWDEELEKAALKEAAKKRKKDKDGPGVESLGALSIDDIEQAADSVFEGDDAAANGSSICVLAEFDGRKAVLTGDAHAPLVAQSLGKLKKNGKPVEIDAYKLSHHGSRGTHSAEVMQQIKAKHFLISTDGSHHKHPHLEAIARTIKHGGGDIELVFNYSRALTTMWDFGTLKKKFGYATRYPREGEAGVIGIELPEKRRT